MKNILLSIVAVAAIYSNSFAQAPKAAADPAAKALTQLEKDWAQALVKADGAAVDRLEAPEYVFTDPDGVLMTKAQGLADLKTGALKFQSLSIEDIEVHVFGDMAFVTSINVTKGTYKGADISGRSRWTDVFVKRDGKWLVVASHGSNIKK